MERLSDSVASADRLSRGKQLGGGGLPGDLMVQLRQLAVACWHPLDVQGPPELWVQAQSSPFSVMHGLWQDVVMEGFAERTGLECR